LRITWTFPEDLVGRMISQRWFGEQRTVEELRKEKAIHELHEGARKEAFVVFRVDSWIRLKAAAIG
jgi:hypothetical protein